MALASSMRPAETTEVYLLIGQLQQKVADLSVQVQACRVCHQCRCNSIQATVHSGPRANTQPAQHTARRPRQHGVSPAYTAPAASLPSQPLTTGVVKWFSTTRGYGFVTRHDTGSDVFCHYKAIIKPNPGHQRKTLVAGETVEFTVKTTRPGFPEAQDVTGPNDTAVQGCCHANQPRPQPPTRRAPRHGHRKRRYRRPDDNTSRGASPQSSPAATTEEEGDAFPRVLAITATPDAPLASSPPVLDSSRSAATVEPTATPVSDTPCQPPSSTSTTPGDPDLRATEVTRPSASIAAATRVDDVTATHSPAAARHSSSGGAAPASTRGPYRVTSTDAERAAFFKRLTAPPLSSSAEVARPCVGPSASVADFPRYDDVIAGRRPAAATRAFADPSAYGNYYEDLATALRDIDDTDEVAYFEQCATCAQIAADSHWKSTGHFNYAVSKASLAQDAAEAALERAREIERVDILPDDIMASLEQLEAYWKNCFNVY